jgi:hypothetical protein
VPLEQVEVAYEDSARPFRAMDVEVKRDGNDEEVLWAIVGVVLVRAVDAPARGEWSPYVLFDDVAVKKLCPAIAADLQLLPPAPGLPYLVAGRLNRNMLGVL